MFNPKMLGLPSILVIPYWQKPLIIWKETDNDDSLHVSRNTRKSTSPTCKFAYLDAKKAFCWAHYCMASFGKPYYRLYCTLQDYNSIIMIRVEEILSLTNEMLSRGFILKGNLWRNTKRIVSLKKENHSKASY